VNDDLERAWLERRTECWRQFLAAVDSGLSGNWAGCAAIVGVDQYAATELRNVIRAIRDGRLVRTPEGLAVTAKGRRAKRVGESGGGDPVGEPGMPDVSGTALDARDS
jgi:hypothetical protein